MNEKEIIEIKSDINILIKKLVDILNLEIPYLELNNSLKKYYDKGLNQTELALQMNFTRNDDNLNLLTNYTMDNLKGFNAELRETLRKEITRSVMNLESTPKVMERIRKIRDISIDRARVIARTELNRAENMGQIDAANQSELDLLKEWSAQRERTSRLGNKVPCPQCEHLDGQIVKINGFFTDLNGQKILQPPHHPNCACSIIIKQKPLKKQ